MKKIVNSVYEVYSEKLPGSFDGVKLVMLSDLHDNVYGISLDRLYEIIVEQEPELVIVAGDLLTRKHSDGSDEVVALLKRLADRYPVFFANGNHETKVRIYTEKYGDRYDRLIAALRRAGVPEDGISLDKLSLTTADNMLGSLLELSRTVGLKDIHSLIIVTADFHMPRALLLAEKFIPDFIEVIPSPAKSPVDEKTWVGSAYEDIVRGEFRGMYYCSDIKGGYGWWSESRVFNGTEKK